MKLYPPNIEGTIPAFCGTTLVVPFSLNKAVSKSEISGFALKIKTVQGSTLLGTIKQMDRDCFDLDSFCQVQFNVSNFNFSIGQYYKVQLAFIDNTNTVGYYSTVGVIKYTAKPMIEISGLVVGAINNHNYQYTATYSQKGQDPTEKLYSSRFKLFDAEGHVVKDSGEILHNVANDDSAYEAHEDFTLAMDLDSNNSYYLQYFATTSNGYTCKTGQYRLMQKKSITPELKASLSAKLNYEEGYIDLYLVGDKDEAGLETIAIGSFVVCRAASNENYVWNKVCEFSLQSQTPSRFLWRDYTIEQGVSYQYSVQQYNDYGLYSDRMLSSTITADFEDAFLFDGERQLKIRFNPKISSFKTDLLESKMDTIGSKHPFIFRNGNVCYKEFPISGLISYQMDDNQLFCTWKELGISEKSIDFTSKNILGERLFKLKVLDWLNNGEPKIFKSPAEGNYIVRLMNNSLSPLDNLGRMLHNFSSTAYEIADFNYENLFNFNFITISTMSTVQTRWATVELAGHSSTLDTMLENIRRYTNAGMAVSFSEEHYNRLLSYNYQLKDYFTQQSTISSYQLKDNTPESALTDIGNILLMTIQLNRLFTPAEYKKVIEKRDDLTQYFEAKSNSVVYVLKANIPNTILSTLESARGAITYVTGRVNTRPALSIFCVDMLPGTIIQLCTKQAGVAEKVEEIMIGATGSYRAEFDVPVTSIKIPQLTADNHSTILTTGIQGSITYTYESTAVNVFDTIRNLEMVDIPDQQWIGKQTKTYYDMELDREVVTDDLISIIQDSKTTIVDMFALRFEKRPLGRIFVNKLATVDGEYNGVPLDSLPVGVSLVPVRTTDPGFVYRPNTYYKQFQRITHQDFSDPDNPIITYRTYYQLVNSSTLPQGETLYTKSYKYYLDMNCTEEVDFDQLDPYCVYMVCNARFDYTYQNVWYEGYYIDRMFNAGFYVDASGRIYPVFTGTLLDGQSTSMNRIFYDDTTFSYKIYINGEEIDLIETERFSLNKFPGAITSVKFDNGIICDASYQIRRMAYNVEDTDSTVRAYKAEYDSYVNKLQALRALESAATDYSYLIKDLLQAGYNENSKEYKNATAQYENTKAANIATLGQDYNNGNYQFVQLFEYYSKQIKSSYAAFIHQLDLALRLYREENSIR